ncbi:hypothetical protein [Streptomyces sp. NPDC055632]
MAHTAHSSGVLSNLGQLPLDLPRNEGVGGLTGGLGTPLIL